MLREEELLEMADAYRYLAKAASDARLRLEFIKRAELYETVASIAGEPPRFGRRRGSSHSVAGA